MKKTMFVCFLFIGLFFLASCASLGTARKTKELRIGMTDHQVTSLLGSPQGNFLQEDFIVYKYILHEYWKGRVFHYLFFDKDTMLLVSAVENEQEYRQDQLNLMGVARNVQLASSNYKTSSETGFQEYEIEASLNDNLFIVSKNVFEAKTYCFNVLKGDKVVFIEGKINSFCSQAKFLNLRTKSLCDVWCKN